MTKLEKERTELNGVFWWYTKIIDMKKYKFRLYPNENEQRKKIFPYCLEYWSDIEQINIMWNFDTIRDKMTEFVKDVLSINNIK